MTIAQIPVSKRESVFAEICRVIRDAEATDRALSRLDEGLSAEEPLQDVLQLLTSSAKPGKKAKALA